MSERTSPLSEEKLDRLVHDISGSLHAIGMGVVVLNDVRNDENRYKEVCDSIVSEQENAVALLRQLQEAIRRNDRES